MSLTSPRNNSFASRTVKVAATASDAVGVAGVQFKLDGVDHGTEDRYAPFALYWDTRTAANRGYAITAVARDGAANVATSARKMTVRNR